MQSGKKSLAAFLWDFLGVFVKRFFSFGISILLARLLSPEDFGLVGMALVFLSLFQVFVDFGLSSALIQNKDNSKGIYDAVFTLNLILGIFFFCLFYFNARIISDFYENAKIEKLMQFLSFSFVISALGIVQKTRLKRNIDFKKLTILSTISEAIGGVCALILALAGFGVYALVAQYLISLLVNTVLLWRLSEWKPSFSFRFSGLTKLLQFSVFIFFDNLIAVILKRSSVLIIGKYMSPTVLGYYSRGESFNNYLNVFIARPMHRVSYPIFSEINNKNPANFNSAFSKIFEVVVILTVLLIGVFYVSGDFLIVFLFGEKWTPSIPYFELLILTAFYPPINSLIVNSITSKGDGKVVFLSGIVRKVIKSVPLLFLMIYVDIFLFLYLSIAVSVINTIFNTVIASKYLGLSFWKIWKIIALPVLLMSALIYFFEYWTSSILIVKTIAIAGIYCITFVLVRRDLVERLKGIFTNFNF